METIEEYKRKLWFTFENVLLIINDVVMKNDDYEVLHYSIDLIDLSEGVAILRTGLTHKKKHGYKIIINVDDPLDNKTLTLLHKNLTELLQKSDFPSVNIYPNTKYVLITFSYKKYRVAIKSTYERSFHEAIKEATRIIDNVQINSEVLFVFLGKKHVIIANNHTLQHNISTKFTSHYVVTNKIFHYKLVDAENGRTIKEGKLPLVENITNNTIRNITEKQMKLLSGNVREFWDDFDVEIINSTLKETSKILNYVDYHDIQNIISFKWEVKNTFAVLKSEFKKVIIRTRNPVKISEILRQSPCIICIIHDNKIVRLVKENDEELITYVNDTPVKKLKIIDDNTISYLVEAPDSVVLFSIDGEILEKINKDEAERIFHKKITLHHPQLLSAFKVKEVTTRNIYYGAIKINGKTIIETHEATYIIEDGHAYPVTTFITEYRNLIRLYTLHDRY
jgi:hypothetical protein